MKRIHLLSGLLGGVVLLSGCASNTGDSELPEIVRVPRVTPYHIAKEGETVGSISKEYGMKRADLIRLNKLQPPYQLYDGQNLVIIPRVEEEKSGEIDKDIVIKETKESENQIIAEKDNLASKKEEKTQKESDVNHNEDKDQHSENGEKTSTVGSENEVIEEKESMIEEAAVEPEYELPIPGAIEKISTSFGPKNDGIIMDASAGTRVNAIADGVVIISGSLGEDAPTYGKTVVIKHTAKKKLSVYANLGEPAVKVGQKVTKGTKIGIIGKSGSGVKKPQLRLETYDISKHDSTGKVIRKLEDPKILLLKGRQP